MRLIRFFKAIIKHILFGKRTSIDEYIERLSICKNCKQFDVIKWSCKKCGCYLDKKAKMSTEKCPDNKW
jgi:ribosomal protein L32